MLDADQARIAADAVDLTGKAAELFLEALAGKARTEASGAARSTVSSKDIGAPQVALEAGRAGSAALAHEAPCFALCSLQRFGRQ